MFQYLLVQHYFSFSLSSARWFAWPIPVTWIEAFLNLSVFSSCVRCFRGLHRSLRVQETANEWVAALGKKCSASVFCLCLHMYVLETLRFGFRFEMKKSVELSESESGIVRSGNRDENKYILSRQQVVSLHCTMPRLSLTLPRLTLYTGGKECSLCEVSRQPLTTADIRRSQRSSSHSSERHIHSTSHTSTSAHHRKT